MDFTGLAISLISGVIGGNIIGAAWKDKSLGAIGNSIAGLVGGVAGTYIMQAVGFLQSAGIADMSINSLLGNAGSAGVGGAILTAIIGIIRKSIANKT
jgi:uncharacterized membrane protein YeaQ/YmgE (transglycosylase-associated protein family)